MNQTKLQLHNQKVLWVGAEHSKPISGDQVVLTLPLSLLEVGISENYTL